MRLNGQQIQQVYLEAIIQNHRKIDKEINERLEDIGKINNIIRTTFLGRKEIPKRIKRDF